MNTHATNLVANWFRGLNEGDLSGLLDLFTSNPTIANAANPPSSGPDAARQLLTDFFNRTTARHFVVLDTAQNGRVVYAGWLGILSFAPSVNIAGNVLSETTSMALRGAELFELDDNGRIKTLLIAHETSSVPMQARAVAASGSPASAKAVNAVELLERYFRAEEAGDDEAVVAMCHPSVIIRNAAQPPAFGLEGARAFVRSFRDRTVSRRFSILNVAQHDNVAYAHWEGQIIFRSGATFGAIVAKKDFPVTLHGILRVRLTPNAQFAEIDVMHETTSAARLAQATVE